MTALNEQQRKAAQFKDGICAVITVPGSGKTTVMTHRIGVLVKKHGVPPENILGLTFTRNAAETMRHRLTPILDEMASRVTLSTIHSFCYWILKSEGKVFEILSGKEQILFLRRIMRDMGFRDFSVGMVLREISLAKNNLIPVSEYRSLYEGDKTMLKVAEVYDAYDAEKAKKMLMDFDDLLVETHRLLSEKKEVLEKYKSSFRHVLIDEVQDTNPAQMEIIKLLINGSPGNGSSFSVYGDDWQAIYSFTGASVGNILNFKKMFPGSKQFILNVNYRSTPQILTACQNLISHNAKKIDKTLETHNRNGDQVIVLECSSEEDEATDIAEEVTSLVQGKGYAYKDITILYRANFQSRVIEEVFSQEKIPYRIENGMNFYERFEVKVLLDYLRLILSPESDEGDDALRSIINIPNRYLGKKFVRELEAFSAKTNLHFYPALKKMPIVIPYLKKNTRDLISFIDPLMENKTMGPAELIGLLRESLDYDQFITEDDVPSPDDSKIANINQLQMVATKYRDIASFLTFTDSFQDATANDSEGVSLMTIHKSKGMEFPVVFVVGLVEGILPTKKGDIEEERRICFVGISRAMKILYLSHSHTYLGQPSKKSIFLDEMLGTTK
jgi:DNA helicase II / ATP-dependent DNA helicase PcrA